MRVKMQRPFTAATLILGLLVGTALPMDVLSREVPAQKPEQSPPHFASDNTTWAIETVDSEGDVGQHPSLAVDDSGTPHIAYHDVTNDRVKYAVRRSTEWTTEMVEGSALGPSLALDASDNPHIAYCDVRPSPPHGPGEGLKYAHLTTGGWVIESVDGVDCDFPSLGLDDSETPHIAYHDVANDSVKYAGLRGSTWVNETVETSTTGPSLALDASGNPHIAYTQRGPYVKYAVLRDARWVSETVDGAAADPSLVLDGSGNAHIAYCDVRPPPPQGPGRGIKYAYRAASAWVIESVEVISCGASSRQPCTALALDRFGDPHVSYYDGDNGNLKHAQAAVTPGPGPGWGMVGQVGGRTEDVAVQGDYAYVALGLRLVVLDVSDRRSPREIGSTTPFPQFVHGVAVSSTLAYVAAGMAGLRVVDVSNPSDPVEVGAYDTPGYAEGVAVAGQYAYVADGHYGLRIVDIADPAHPTEIAYAYPLNYVFDVAVDGRYAYLAAAGAGLLVMDISDPAYPAEMGTFDTPGYAYGVDVAGNVVYVADGWEGLRVVNTLDPAYPVEVGSYDTPG